MPSEAEIYARVIAAKPELAVPDLVFERHFWTQPLVNGQFHTLVALALIESHWMDELLKCPEVSEVNIFPSWAEPGYERCVDLRTFAQHMGVLINTDRYKTHSVERKQIDESWGKDMFHALAEFHVPGSTKGAE